MEAMRKSKRWLSACLLTLILCLGVFCTPAMADNSTRSRRKPRSRKTAWK